MIVTEKEAATKWCPLARLTGSENVAWNRVETSRGEHYSTMCIGSQCMAWRWAFEASTQGDVSIAKDDTGYRVGFCGAFGEIGQR